jgi:signal transduction histidine kinase
MGPRVNPPSDPPSDASALAAPSSSVRPRDEAAAPLLTEARAALEREHRQVQRIAHRMARLQAAGAALAEATAPDAIAAVTLQHARAALGSRHGLFAVLSEDQTYLDVVRAAGFQRDGLLAWGRIPVAARMPFAEAARTGELVLLEDLDDVQAGGPEMEAMLRATGASACVAAPLVAGGRVLAVLGLCFAIARRFTADDRAFLAGLGAQAGQALARAQKVALERREQALAAFLVEATGELSSSLDSPSILARAARLAVPYLAQWCAVDLIEPDGRLVRMAAAHVDPAQEIALRDGLLRDPVDPRGDHPLAIVARTGEPRLVTDGLPDEGADAPSPSTMIVPLIARGRVLGALTFASPRASRRYGLSDLALAQNLAHRAALAVDNARLYEEARSAISLRDELLTVVSHDLRNPLGVIGAVVATMRRTLASGTGGERIVAHCDAIARSTARMTALIDGLLDVDRIASGGLAIELAVHDAAAMIDDAIASLGPLATPRRITLRAEPIAAPIAVVCDRARVQQVFANLVGNALKLTPEGGSVVLAVTPGEGFATFAVTDDGPGIEPEHLPHLFERYWQAPETARLGRGLGLAIVKGIVDAHHGCLSVTSELGKGATFSFTLPTPPSKHDADVT